MLRLAVALAFALPAAAQEKPAVAFQAKSPAALLSHVREAVKVVGGQPALDDFEKSLADRLGEDGLKGLNLTQPVVGYARLDGKPEETAFVLVVPITGDKDFLDLLDRADVKLEEVEGDKGAFAFGGQQFDFPIHIRMTPTHAYVAFNGTPKTVAAKALIPVKDLLDEAEAGLFVLHVHPGRAAKDYAALAGKALDKLAADENLGDTETKWIAGLKPMAETLLTQIERLTVRGDLDPATKMAAVDVQLAPKEKSLLGLGFAMRKPSANRFAGAAEPAGIVQSMLLTAPAWTKEIRDAMGASLDQLAGLMKQIFGPGTPAGAMQPALGAVIAGMAAAAKDGRLDFATITPAPDKNGFVTSAYAVKVNNPDEIEKELRALAQAVADDRAPLAKKITLEAAKHAGAAIHTFDLGEFLDKKTQGLVGADAKLAVACGKDAFVLAVGADAVGGVKLLLDAKPAPAPPFVIQLRPKGFAQAYRGMGMMEAVETALGTGDKQLTVVSVSSSSEAAGLRLRTEVSLAFIRFVVDVSNAGP